MKLIICVCRGNIARSPFAEEIITKEIQSRGLNNQYSSISRGIQGTIVDPQPVKFPNITYYGKLYSDLKPVLDKFGIDLSSHISTPIDHEIAEKASILLAMDNQTRHALQTLFPNELRKIHLLSEIANKEGGAEIVDPENIKDRKKHEKIFTEIRNIIIQGFPKLLKMI